MQRIPTYILYVWDLSICIGDFCESPRGVKIQAISGIQLWFYKWHQFHIHVFVLRHNLQKKNIAGMYKTIPN